MSVGEFDHARERAKVRMVKERTGVRPAKFPLGAALANLRAAESPHQEGTHSDYLEEALADLREAHDALEDRSTLDADLVGDVIEWVEEDLEDATDVPHPTDDDACVVCGGPLHTQAEHPDYAGTMCLACKQGIVERDDQRQQGELE